MYESSYSIRMTIQHYRSMLAVTGIRALTGAARRSVERLIAEAEETLRLSGEDKTRRLCLNSRQGVGHLPSGREEKKAAAVVKRMKKLLAARKRG